MSNVKRVRKINRKASKQKPKQSRLSRFKIYYEATD